MRCALSGHSSLSPSLSFICLYASSVIAFDLFLLVVIGLRLTPSQTRRKSLLYFVWAQVIPLLLAVVATADHGYNQSTTLAWCFLAEPDQRVLFVLFW
jgi:hypothetical protein